MMTNRPIIEIAIIEIIGVIAIEAEIAVMPILANLLSTIDRIRLHMQIGLIMTDLTGTTLKTSHFV